MAAADSNIAGGSVSQDDDTIDALIGDTLVKRDEEAALTSHGTSINESFMASSLVNSSLDQDDKFNATGEEEVTHCITHMVEERNEAVKEEKKDVLLREEASTLDNADEKANQSVMKYSLHNIVQEGAAALLSSGGTGQEGPSSSMLEKLVDSSAEGEEQKCFSSGGESSCNSESSYESVTGSGDGLWDMQDVPNPLFQRQAENIIEDVPEPLPQLNAVVPRVEGEICISRTFQSVGYLPQGIRKPLQFAIYERLDSDGVPFDSRVDTDLCFAAMQDVLRTGDMAAVEMVTHAPQTEADFLEMIDSLEAASVAFITVLENLNLPEGFMHMFGLLLKPSNDFFIVKCSSNGPLLSIIKTSDGWGRISTPFIVPSLKFIFQMRRHFGINLSCVLPLDILLAKLGTPCRSSTCSCVTHLSDAVGVDNNDIVRAVAIARTAASFVTPLACHTIDLVVKVFQAAASAYQALNTRAAIQILAETIQETLSPAERIMERTNDMLPHANGNDDNTALISALQLFRHQQAARCFKNMDTIMPPSLLLELTRLDDHSTPTILRCIEGAVLPSGSQRTVVRIVQNNGLRTANMECLRCLGLGHLGTFCKSHNVFNAIKKSAIENAAQFVTADEFLSGSPQTSAPTAIRQKNLRACGNGIGDCQLPAREERWVRYRFYQTDGNIRVAGPMVTGSFISFEC